MITRRTFVKNSAATVVTSCLMPWRMPLFPPDKTIGIQLYTLRDQVADDFKGTLEKLAKIGYNSIEAAGYSDRMFYGFTPKEYKNIVTNLGLNPQSTHCGINTENASQVIDDTLEAGMKYLVLPSIPAQKRKSADDYRRVAEEFNKIGEQCKSAGLLFAYHNHSHEFKQIDGVIPYNLLLENTDSDAVAFQLDIYWMVYGGYDPVDYFNAYPGRFKLWHIKDMDRSDDKGSTEIGQGTIDFEKLFRLKDKAGLLDFYVEQEAFKIPPFDSVKISFDYLNKLQI